MFANFVFTKSYTDFFFIHFIGREILVYVLYVFDWNRASLKKSKTNRKKDNRWPFSNIAVVAAHIGFKANLL